MDKKKEPKKPGMARMSQTSLFNPLTKHRQTDTAGGDDDGSGGKQSGLKAGIVESAARHSKAQKQDKEQHDRDQSRQEKIDRELEKHQIQAESANRYLQSLLSALRNGGYSADSLNIDSALNKHTENIFRATSHTAVELGVQPNIGEQLHYAQMAGSITGTISGESGKSIFAMESDGPINRWDALQIINPHAASWAVSQNYNPFGPAKHYVLTGGHAEASQVQQFANQSFLNKQTSLMFQQNLAKQNIQHNQQPVKISINRYTGFTQNLPNVHNTNDNQTVAPIPTYSPKKF